MHRFYQEIYQVHGGRQDRYVTGSDAVGLSMGYYDTRRLPLYRYLHEDTAPHYVLADHFFAGAFGGSYLNHQYLVGAQPPRWTGAPVGEHSVLDDDGMVADYPLYRPTGDVYDGALTQQCGAAADENGLACGDWTVNTVLPARQPTADYAPKMPLVDDTEQALNIVDRLSDAGVSWAWSSGGWDNAAGNVGGRGYTNGNGPGCADGDSTPATPDIDGRHDGYPYCPHRSFQFQHQPLGYFARYAPGTPGRTRHLRDEVDFLRAARSGRLPAVSFVEPLGEDSEHPGYASERTRNEHLVDLLRAVVNGPQGGHTLVVAYDEFGGQWDHVSPPGERGPGAYDQFGPGTRVPALLVGRPLGRSTVEHTSYDTTSIMATIERAYGLRPVDHPDGVTPRDRRTADLRAAVRRVAGPG